MSAGKISPPPWDAGQFTVGDANDRMVAECFGDSEAIAAANATLIARAPQLLERLKQRVLTCSCEKSLDCGHCSADLRAMQGLESDNG